MNIWFIQPLPLAITLLKVASVIVLFVISTDAFFVFNIQVRLSILPLAAWVVCLYCLAASIQYTLSYLEVVDCALELTFHSSSGLFSVTKLFFFASKREQMFNNLFLQNKNNLFLQNQQSSSFNSLLSLYYTIHLQKWQQCQYML